MSLNFDDLQGSWPKENASTPPPLPPDRAKGGKAEKSLQSLVPLSPPESSSSGAALLPGKVSKKSPAAEETGSKAKSPLKDRLNTAVASVKDVFSRGILRWSPVQVAKVKSNLIQHATRLKTEPLNPQELRDIDRQIETLQKINRARKSTLETVAATDTKAAWTVRTTKKITIGGQQYDLHLGRNLKALLVYPTAGEIVGKGGFGKVREIAMELKTNLGVLEKKDSRSPEEHGLETAENQAILLESFRKEVQLPRELHKKAGGYQTGIQRAPYTAVDLQSLDEHSDLSSLGILVHRYETTLEPKKMGTLTPAQQKQYGLDNKKGPLKMLQGLFTGVRAMHDLKMAHRDIKPENCGIQRSPSGKPESCLADFGLAAHKSPEYPAGTPWYVTTGECHTQLAAPSDEARLELQQKQDIYALGITVLQVLNSLVTAGGELNNVLDDYGVDGRFRKYPLRESDRIKELLNHVEQRFGTAVKDLLYAMLDPDPTKRPTAAAAEKIWSKACSPLPGLKRTAKKQTTSIALGLFDSCPETKKAITQLVKKNKNYRLKEDDLALLRGYNQLSSPDQGEKTMGALGRLGITVEMLQKNNELKEELVRVFAFVDRTSSAITLENLEACLKNPWNFM